jgi:hypothetical protein
LIRPTFRFSTVFRLASRPGRVQRRIPMDKPIKVIAITGFDPEGEPEVRSMADGSLYIVFNFMPPSWAEDDPDSFDDFDQQLSKTVGLPVEWEDREFFRIERPAKDTVERVQRFLASYKRP